MKQGLENNDKKARDVIETAVSKLISRRLVPYYFLLPYFIVFAVFWAYPIIWAPWMSLQEFGFLGNSFVGLDHYHKILQPDSVFLKTVLNTFLMAALVIPLEVIGGLIIAVLLNSALTRFTTLFRSVFILPLVVSSVVIAVIFSILLQDAGLANLLLNSIAGISVPWLTDPQMAKVSVSIAVSWKWVGLAVIIFLAGLQGIPDHLYEAAKIDGANRLEQFRYITLPQLRPITTLVVILMTTRTLKMFAIPFVLTQGGPGRSSMPVVHRLWESAFQELNFGEAAAMGVVLAIIIGVLMIVQYRIGDQEDVR
jgi:ABC-type sugar transport system permease subunit